MLASLLVTSSFVLPNGRGALVAHATVNERICSCVCQTLPPGFVWAENEELTTPPSLPPAVDPEQLDVVNDADEVATVVRNRLNIAATTAIAERGHFALCASWS